MFELKGERTAVAAWELKSTVMHLVLDGVVGTPCPVLESDSSPGAVVLAVPVVVGGGGADGAAGVVAVAAAAGVAVVPAAAAVGVLVTLEVLRMCYLLVSLLVMVSVTTAMNAARVRTRSLMSPRGGYLE